MILLIDNYDSFTYNLYHYLVDIDQTVNIVRNDQITSQEIHNLQPDRIIISPGPGAPNQAGNLMSLFDDIYQDYPILGICLGHQAIAQYFGATVSHAKTVMHGKCSRIATTAHPLFNTLPPSFYVTRYHSLAIQAPTMPNCLKTIAWTEVDDNSREIMAIAHESLPIAGVQFHPEAILTEYGHQLLANFCSD
ncbi:MAG: anthranilate synthase component II [Gammaproteobacteria bacterium]